MGTRIVPKSKGKPLPLIEKALDSISWQNLAAAYPELADAIDQSIAAGATPDEIYRSILERTDRESLAKWGSNAAAHLARAEE